MSEDDDSDLLVVGDRRHMENEAGAIDLSMDASKAIIHTGGGSWHEIVFLTEEDAEELYNQLDKLFGGD